MTKNNEVTLTRLEEEITQALNDENLEVDFLVMWVKGATPKPEIIINTRDNFENKLAYFKNAYTEDLKLKAKPDIHIEWFELMNRHTLSWGISTMGRHF